MVLGCKTVQAVRLKPHVRDVYSIANWLLSRRGEK